MIWEGMMILFSDLNQAKLELAALYTSQAQAGFSQPDSSLSRLYKFEQSLNKVQFAHVRLVYTPTCKK